MGKPELSIGGEKVTGAFDVEVNVGEFQIDIDNGDIKRASFMKVKGGTLLILGVQVLFREEQESELLKTLATLKTNGVEITKI